MQVLVVLADAANQVVTRSTLFNRCWGSTDVGDDSLNRAIASVRRIADGVAAGNFHIETIPRTGYRLTSELAGASGESEPAPTTPARQPLLTRRAVIGAAAAVAVGAGGLGFWFKQSAEGRQFGELMERGEELLDYGDPSANPIPYFQRALTLRPDDLDAGARFAYSVANRGEDGLSQASLIADAERTARAVVANKPASSYAQLAIVLLERSVLDIASTEERLRAILRNSQTTHAMRHLWNLLQSAGRSREALEFVERAIRLEPFAAMSSFPRAQLLWIVGRNAEADRVIDRAIQIWPSHRFVRFARFTILAFTDRPQAALAMIENAATRPQGFSPAVVDLWKVLLAALEQRSPSSIAAARDASLRAVKRNPKLTSHAVLSLSALGETDAAFEIANQLLVYRRAVERRSQPPGRALTTNSNGWRFLPWLFTPPAASLRADPRFETLCEGIGLSEYWIKRGITPDYKLGVT